MASVSAREANNRWLRLINNNERYYFSKAMDVFYSMEEEDQRSLLVFFAEQTKTPSWETKAEDSTQYPSVIRAILVYYSGRKELSQPTKEEFKELMGKWIRIHEKAKKKVILKRESKDFKKELEDI